MKRLAPSLNTFDRPADSCLLACLAGAAVATILFFLALGHRPLPFLADDYAHLAASYGPKSFTHHFAQWLGRVPVWSVVAWWLFHSHILETSWWPMTFFFALHCVGVALVAAYVSQFGVSPTRLGLWTLATAVVSFYSNTYELIFWPTCMPYTLGAALMGLALWARYQPFRIVLVTLAMLTYETFILPMGCLLMALDLRRGTWQGRLEWGSALGFTLAVRAIFSHLFGPFRHQTRFDLHQMALHAMDAALMLGRLRHPHMHTERLGTTCLLVTLTIGGALWLRRDKSGACWVLLLGCLASTAQYWILAYDAARAIYGAQILLCAILVCLIAQIAQRATAGRLLATVLIMGMALGFTMHQREIISIKRANATILHDTEVDLAVQLRACPQTCLLEARPPVLKTDWVLPGDFWNNYLDWLCRKYAPEKAVSFVQQEV